MLKPITYVLVDLPLILILSFNVGLMTIELFSASFALIFPALYICSKIYDEIELVPKFNILALASKANLLAILSVITDFSLEKIVASRSTLGKFSGPLFQFITMVPIIYGFLMRLVILKQIYESLYYLVKPFLLIGVNSYMSVFKQTNGYCFSVYRYFVPVKSQEQELEDYLPEEYTDSTDTYEEE